MFLNISQNSQENICTKAYFLIKLSEACNFIKKNTLAKVLFCEFCEFFKKAFFTENLRVTASDIWMQVVVIHNLNLLCNLQRYTLHFLFCEFSQWRMLQCRLNFCIGLFFGRVIFSHALQNHF